MKSKIISGILNPLFWLTYCLLIISCIGNKEPINEDVLNKKNIVFIIADDLTKTLGCYDHPIVKTPNIDKLASMGVQFDNAHCNFAVCNPSRVSLLTGLTPETTTIIDNKKTLQSVIGDWVTLPALFSKNGYNTYSLGKIFHGTKPDHNDIKAWDEIYHFKNTELGKTGEGRNLTNNELKWCRWLASEGIDEDLRDGQVAKKSVEIIKTKHEKPFFLAIGFHKPHDPFYAPKKYFDLYPLDKCTPPTLPENWQPANRYSLPNNAKIVFDKFTDKDKREFLRSYYACTSYMDAQVGKVLSALEETGQIDNTIIVFFGDHGYHLGEHNWWNKVTIYEKGTAAPFIISGPTIENKGIRSEAMFEFIDIYPTMAELMNLKQVPDYLEGRSFLDIIHNPDKPFRSEVYALTRRGEILGRAVKNSKWRYIEWDEGKKGKELYDQANDPIEYHNLADNPKYEDIVLYMSNLLSQKH